MNLNFKVHEILHCESPKGYFKVIFYETPFKTAAQMSVTLKPDAPFLTECRKAYVEDRILVFALNDSTMKPTRQTNHSTAFSAIAIIAAFVLIAVMVIYQLVKS